MISTATAEKIIDYAGETLLRYEPLLDVAPFHKSLAKTRWLLGGNRSGKSEGNIGADLVQFAMGLHPHRPTLQRDVTIWVATETWAAVGKILWEEKLKQYIPHKRIIDIRWHNRGDLIPKQVVLLREGNLITTLEFKAFEQGRKAFEGRAIDAFYGDEQCKSQSYGIWLEIQARLMDRNGFVAWSMTPIIYQRWFENRILKLPRTDDVFYVDLENNRKSRGGYVDDKEIDDLIDEWPEEVQETRIKGHLAAFYGAVYRTFNRKVHVIKPIPIPRHWRKYRCIDWGFNNPFVCLWLAVDPDGRWYVYREYYRNRTLILDHANYIKRRSVGEKYRGTFADHDSQDNAELKNYGVETKNANKAVHAGIETVQKLLKVQRDKKPRLYIFETCVNTIGEFPGYKYPEGTDSKNPQDMPMSKDDHTLDALRYGTHSVLAPVPYVKPRILGQLY